MVPHDIDGALSGHAQAFTNDQQVALDREVPVHFHRNGEEAPRQMDGV
jgi:hypothetical protein